VAHARKEDCQDPEKNKRSQAVEHLVRRKDNAVRQHVTEARRQRKMQEKQAADLKKKQVQHHPATLSAACNNPCIFLVLLRTGKRD
jgi:hypothetical protein